MSLITGNNLEGAASSQYKAVEPFTLFLEVPVLSLRRSPALLALLLLLVSLASACNRDPNTADPNNYCEDTGNCE